MGFSKSWIHSVWSTKDRVKILEKEFRYLLFDHIKANGIKKGIQVDCVNGYVEHVHCLFRQDKRIASTGK